MKILFLDDEDWRHKAMDRRHPHDVVQHVHTIRQFKAALERERFDLASLDHDLTDDNSETGMHAVEHLCSMPRELVPARIIVHSWNSHAAGKMMAALRDAGFAPERREFRSERAQQAEEAEQRFKERNG